jgi:hypothetical protein
MFGHFRFIKVKVENHFVYKGWGRMMIKSYMLSGVESGSNFVTMEEVQNKIV